MRHACRFLTLGLVLAAGLLADGARADPGFRRWVDEFWATARAGGVSRATYERAFAGVTPDPEVLEKAGHQAEFVRPIWDYVAGAVSEKRIAAGRALLAQHAADLGRIERAYGVDRHILVAIWGMESSYGEVLGNPKIVRPVVRSLATLAYADAKRARFARQQLVAALKLVERGDVSLDGLTGSWAGAMGHTQFIPTTFEAYGVDFDGDGRRNIWSSPLDALASAANYLRESGWVGGKTWGYEVVLPAGFDFRLADDEARPLAEWQAAGVLRPGRRGFPRPQDKAILVVPAGARGPAFLMLRNHFVIKRYNNATAYALAIGHLADRLRGGGGFVQAWPVAERPLSASETRELQQLLADAGYYQGRIDGKIGPQARAAIRAFQARRGVAPDGYASATLLSALRGG